MPWFSEIADEIPFSRLEELMERTVEEARSRICRRPKRVLLLPPDITRAHSGAGPLTEILYNHFSREAEVHLIPTLGQHVPHTEEENRRMFGQTPLERIHPHDWRAGVKYVGEVSADYVREKTHGAADWAFPVWLNRMLMEESWDLIIHIGHVVPHEVLGFANHNKNYFIGLAGKELICASHMAAACCGIENNLGTLITPVRACFNKAEEDFLGHLPDVYIQLVMARNPEGRLVHTGVYVGDDLETYLGAARQSRQQNITVFEQPVPKIVCVMQGDEFFSTWVANKAIYRTRMAIADGGELLILAPGLKRFGEQPEVDALIRKYGYRGTPRTMEAYRKNADLQDLAHGAAHLIHGSSEGRFTIRYAPGQMTREEIESVGFAYADLQKMWDRYQPDRLREGWQEIDGERFYFIPTPSAGLWSTREKLYNRPAGFET
ncbi:MAG TPA: lactate racemase domain-containing protein [Thermoguttaceae bacterium]|nr:lactate racemase domain-containing protein [Thermoguttaceae bacterium]